MRYAIWFWLLLLTLAGLSGCQTSPTVQQVSAANLNLPAETLVSNEADMPSVPPSETPRPLYRPGELVDYTAQPGDTLPALALRFNTSVVEILEANSFIPADASTMPPGMPMKIPIYYLPFWGTQFKMIPDSHFVNGPAVIGFDTAAFVASQPGWLGSYTVFAARQARSGANLVEYVATNFSVSPRLLLALLEYQAGALSNPVPPPELDGALLGFEGQTRAGLYLQLTAAANALNNGFYRWRSGELLEFELPNGRLERPDPWQNAATVGLQYYFLNLLPLDAYYAAISPDGFAATYQRLFGDAWQDEQPHIPGSLRQPYFLLPFEPGRSWAYTGGPHTGWGSGAPLAGIDFAPPSVAGGCIPSQEWATAVADGVVVRTDEGVAILDLDQDGDERTGWVLLYLHLATEGKAQTGDALLAGQPIGHPSCEGGTSTGTHIHIARKYNGEWMLADSTVPFDLEGWVTKNGSAAYQGTLVRFSKTVVACECANAASQVQREKPEP